MVVVGFANAIFYRYSCDSFTCHFETQEIFSVFLEPVPVPCWTKATCRTLLNRFDDLIAQELSEIFDFSDPNLPLHWMKQGCQSFFPFLGVP